jgi:type VI secretion system protein ImpM
MTAALMPLAYFGKVPSRGDFIRSTHSADLVGTLDRWITQAMEQLSGDPRWKLVYDTATPVDFAFVGPRSAAAIAGQLQPSRDSSDRRFPFVTAGTVDVTTAPHFAARSPLAFARVWSRLQTVGARCIATSDVAALHAELAAMQLDVACDAGAYEAPWRDFLEIVTLGQLDEQVGRAGHQASLRQMLLGLGLLLEPVRSQPTQPIGKGLLLPMVPDRMQGALLGAWWLQIVMSFVEGTDAEIGLLMPQCQPAHLLLCFNSACAKGLAAALDRRAVPDHFIDLRDSHWVEDCVRDQSRLRLLSDHLRDPQLSLRRALGTFHETFKPASGQSLQGGPAHVRNP